MKMTIMRSVIRYGRRQFHTIVSTETIKPSSPTPSHLKTYNLSLLDQTVASTFMPMVAFYPNSGSNNSRLHEKPLDLKYSLSQTLTKYYPFAGRHAKISPTYVDCNDEGAEFHETSIDSTLSDFLRESQHEHLGKFFPSGRVWNDLNHIAESGRVIPLSIQVNQFTCGGLAVAVSLSHKIADATSLINFLRDWANVTRHRPIEPPRVISFPKKKIKFSEFVLQRSKDCVTKSFTFSNSKLSELKHQITVMTKGRIANPTRVEVLSWLLYKCAVAAATRNNSDCFRPTGLGHTIDLRSKMMEPLPENTIGNIIFIVEIQTKNRSDMKPELLIGSLRKQKMEIRGINNIKTAFDGLLSISSEADFQEQRERYNNGYICTSICRSSVYEVDFGWGKPIKATVAGNVAKNSFILMDAANQNGIEALVCLERQDMTIFQSDPHLLAFC